MHNLLGVGFYVKQLELKILYMTELPKDRDTCSRVVISAGVQLWINNCVRINIYPVQVSCPCPSTALPQTLQLHASGKSGRTTTTTPPLLYLGLLFLLLLLLHVLRYKLIDLWDLDSNRMVGVWYLPWRWHILSIPLAAGRGTGAETCGLEDTYIYMHSLYEFCYSTYIYIYIYYNRIVVQYWWSCTPSHSAGLFRGSARFLDWMSLFVFFGLPIVYCSMINSPILGCLWLLVFVSNNILILDIWRSAFSYLPGCVWPWTFL